MAASLSRPDPSSPASVAEAGFSTARRGYQQDEVRAFLVAVAAELGRLQERERQLDAELREARAAAETAPSQLDEATVTELLGEETVRVLQTARESASQIKIRAEEAAARILREANDEANRVRQETEVDAARRRQEASADAEAEVALAKQQGREMVNEARAYRERVLADLDRRTTLARKQIEELIHGRDRLLQVFERARLVAVDVTSELRDIDTPDELVNLAPTTGPLPIMVPNRHRPSEQTSAEAADESTDDDLHDADAGGAAAADDAGTEVPGGADAGGAAEADQEAEPETDGEGSSEPETPPDASTRDRDTNVVSLFRDRSGADDAEFDADETATVDDDAAAADDGETATGDDDPVAADDGETAAGEDGAGPDADAVGGIFARLRDEIPAEETEAAADGEADPHTADDIVAVAVADVGPSAGDVVDTAFTRRDEALVPLIVNAARKIKRVLADEQNLVLDRLRQKEPVAQLDDIVAGVDEHSTKYRQAIIDELTAAAAAGAVELGASDTRTLRNRLGRAGALDDATALLRTALIVPLRDRLERSIVDGGGDNEAITKRIRAVYREWKTQHIDGQLDDVFRYAHGGGIAVTAEPGSPMVWTIDPTEPACPDCEDNSLSGAVAAGEPFPTGHTTAPAHPGCHCLVLPTG